MNDYVFPTQLLGCPVTITVQLKAQVDWNLDAEVDGLQMRTRAERLALGVLLSKRAKAGGVWDIVIASGDVARGTRRPTRRRRKKPDS